MNKKLISEVRNSDGTIVKRYSEEFLLMDVQLDYFTWDGNRAKEGDDVKVYNWKMTIPSRPDLDPICFRRVIFPILDYKSNGSMIVTVEYEEFLKP